MRKLLAAAAMSVLAMTYVAAPEAVGAAVNGTGSLFLTIGRAALTTLSFGTAGGGAPTGQTGGGHIETLPDGTQVWIPDGATVQPAEQ